MLKFSSQTYPPQIDPSFHLGLTPEASLQGLIQPQSSSQVSVLLK